MDAQRRTVTQKKCPEENYYNTSCYSHGSDSPHRRRKRVVQSYAPGGPVCTLTSNTCFFGPQHLHRFRRFIVRLICVTNTQWQTHTVCANKNNNPIEKKICVSAKVVRIWTRFSYNATPINMWRNGPHLALPAVLVLWANRNLAPNLWKIPKCSIAFKLCHESHQYSYIFWRKLSARGSKCTKIDFHCREASNRFWSDHIVVGRKK